MRISHKTPLMNRRQFLGAAGTAAAAVALAGCSGAKSSESTSDSDKGNGKTNLSFVLDYTPNTNHTGLYVAQDQGYFDDEGLSVDLMQPPEDGSDALIGAGSAQMGITAQDTIGNSLSSSQPLPVTAVAALIQHNTSGIMSRAADGITHPAAMMNHRYATWNMPVEQATIKDIVEADGGDYSQVELVPYDVDDDLAGLKANLFDSVWVFEGWACQNAIVQKYDYNYFSFMSIDSVFDFYTPVIAVNDDFAHDNPQTVVAFLRAAKKGYTYAIDNPDAAADILCKAVPELDADLVHQSQSYLAEQYVADASDWGVIDPSRWGRYYQWLNDNNLVENKLDPAAGFDMSYLS